MDGTILTSVPASERAWSTWAVSRGIDPASFLHTIHGVQAVDTIRGLGRPDLDPVREAAAVTELELADTAGVEPITGAREFLEALPRDRWALVTSAPIDLARTRMNAAGVPLPAVLITAEEIRYGKPAPDGFLLAASRLGTTPADCLVFEDSAAGIAAAEAAGATVVVVTAAHRHPMRTPHFTLSSFKNLAVDVDSGGMLAITQSKQIPEIAS